MVWHRRGSSLLLLLFSRNSAAANWAQVSGEKYTNAAVSEITPWANRHGHAVTALDLSDDYERRTGHKSKIFVLGGDSNVQGRQDLRAYPGGGAMRNDVWSTTGPSWNVQANILKTTKWGDPLPQIVANVTWLQTNSGKSPPRGISYTDWISCASAAWAVNPPSGCDDPTRPPGAYLADNMFSPRRNFIALAFHSELFVFGGRAREHIPVPQSQLRGGTGPEPMAPYNTRWLEYAVLKNDVWRSSDAGSSWKLVTPGCPFSQIASAHQTLRTDLQCEDDDQCEGDASCQGDEFSAKRFCVCNMWSPREFHALVVMDDALYLSGGYALVESGKCGDEESHRQPLGELFACSGGYREYLNDIWMSTDGRHWKMLTLHAEFSPRGEHSMVSFHSQLYILGGRTGTSQTESAQTDLLNDVWVSKSGLVWNRVTEAAPWSPRAKHVTLVQPAGASDQNLPYDRDEQLVMMFGEDAERTLEDVWTWKGGDTNWIQDYSSDTPFVEYVRPDSNVSALRTMVDTDARALSAAGLRTIQDITSLSFDQTISLRKLMPICDYIALAKLVVEQCTVESSRFEKQKGFNIAEKATADFTNVVQGETDWDGCTQIGEKIRDVKTGHLRWPDVRGVDQVQVLRDVFVDAQDSICQWRPKARSGHAGIVFKQKILILGGLTAPDYYENDVWYRDARRPRTQFTLVPASGSSDTEFKFESDKPSCIFEYHLLDTVEQLVVRNWTLTLGKVSFESWLGSGTFRMRVRARDPAGNVDETFEDGRNEHTWVYARPLPWGLIIGLLCAGLVLMIGFILEWRKRRKRAALERYAVKRMRRKLKPKNGAVSIAKKNDLMLRKTFDGTKDSKKKSKLSTKKTLTVSNRKDKTKSKPKDKGVEKDIAMDRMEKVKRKKDKFETNGATKAEKSKSKKI
ncbi:Kelch-type beta propeller [Plasmopara halstedii]|uniref:Kelch-type beta propeller n=1 Tax=Plasmopara halstedii TaxID=4781 RepID=A0A0P1AI29_PLAHL|nr:Kelch-type beta propeller [Plasmopara halstedii]CEG40952.1 Kelch-type beta propeller [Plasmopara halstedii]|eukprot:XP_024577321.1 Kelch-type beta propeller [Plasmopara halstedii]